MNAKLQTAIDNFVAAHSALAFSSLGMAKFYVERFMEEGLVETLEREIRTGSNSLSANRLAEVEVLKVFLAEVQAALVEDESISEEISAPAPIVIESDSKEQSYNEYANFMARQEQPYMSEKQWNEAKAERDAKSKKPMYVSVEHANGENAYGAAGHDFESFEDAVAYLKQWGLGFSEDSKQNEGAFCGTIYIFDDETLETEPSTRFQISQWIHESGLWVVEKDGTVSKS